MHDDITAFLFMMFLSIFIMMARIKQQRIRRRRLVATTVVAVVALILLLLLSTVTSFQLLGLPKCSSTRTRTHRSCRFGGSVALVRRDLVSRSTSVDNTNSNNNILSEDSSSSSSAKLQFKALLEYVTPSVPLPSTRNKDIVDFFQTDAYLFLPAGTNNRITNVQTATPEQLAKWRDEAKHNIGAVPPKDGDKVLELSITTPFLVFTIHVISTLGFKLLLPSSSSSSSSMGKEEEEGEQQQQQQQSTGGPEYQFTWIDHKFYAEGPPPLLWMFNRLTGLEDQKQKGGIGGGSDSTTATSNKKSKFQQPSHGIYRVKSVLSDDGTGMAFALRMQSVLNVKFPKSLLAILPVDKKVIESKGNASLKRSMKRDIPPGVDAFRESYLKWLVES